MLFHRALVALDAADHGPRLRQAIRELAGGLGMELVACHVVMRSTSVAGNDLDGAPANPEETRLLERLRGLFVEELGDPGRGVPLKILHGDPGERICEYADYARCDLIVLESRTPTLARRLRGSVTKFVVGTTPRSVLVVGD